jgi:integrase
LRPPQADQNGWWRIAQLCSPFRPTCRSVEIKNLRWQDDLFGRVATIRRSKTAAGHRNIPLNGDAMAALARLLERVQTLGNNEPEHYVFPACEVRIIDPSRPQKS